MNWLHELLLDMTRAYRGYIGSTLSEAPDRWREYRRASVAVMLRVRGMRKHYVARAQAAEERARRAEQALRDTADDLDAAASWLHYASAHSFAEQIESRAKKLRSAPPPAATETTDE